MKEDSTASCCSADFTLIGIDLLALEVDPPVHLPLPDGMSLTFVDSPEVDTKKHSPSKSRTMFPDVSPETNAVTPLLLDEVFAADLA